MTAIGGRVADIKRPGELGVHSMDSFNMQVPDLRIAEDFYKSFGLDVRDPWGSYAEYPADIDYIPSACDWDAGDFPPEISIYLWGPEIPKDFIVNHKTQV